MAFKKVLTPEEEDIRNLFPEFFPSVFPVVNTPIIFHIERVLKGPLVQDHPEWGIPLIAEIAIHTGAARLFIDENQPTVPLEKDAIYSLWLFHGVLKEWFLENRPRLTNKETGEVGETVGIKYLGIRVKRDALKAGRDFGGVDVHALKPGDTYHSYSCVCVDRPVVDTALTWDDAVTATARPTT
jgi:hypothetical protein